jgi:hypothetical protein
VNEKEKRVKEVTYLSIYFLRLNPYSAITAAANPDYKTGAYLQKPLPEKSL